MTPQSLILQHHIKMYAAAKSLHWEGNLAMSIVSESIKQNNPNLLVDILTNQCEVPREISKVIATSAEKKLAPTVDEHVEAYKLLEGNYTIPSSGTVLGLQQYPETKPLLIKAHQARHPILNSSDDIYKRLHEFAKYKSLFALLGRELDIRYWDACVTAAENLRNAGITAKNVMKLIIPYLQTQFKAPDLFPELWDVKTINSFIDTEKFMDAFGFLVSDKAEQDTNGLNNRLVKLLIATTDHDLTNESEWLEHGDEPDTIKVFFWILRNKRWYAGNTLVHNDQIGGNLSVNHHEVISRFISHASAGKKHSADEHPKDVCKVSIAALAQIKANALVSGTPSVVWEKYPSGLCNLPPNWEFIGTNYRLITEGQTMNHCCGGNNYQRKCAASEALFFHVNTDEPHGLTVELKLDGADRWGDIHEWQLGFMDEEENMRNTIAGLIGTDIFSTVKTRLVHSNGLSRGSWRTYRLGQVKGRFNREPTKRERDLVKIGLLSLTDLDEFEKGCRQPYVGVITADEVKTFSITSPEAKSELIKAIDNEYSISFRKTDIYTSEDMEEIRLKQEYIKLNDDVIKHGGKKDEFVCPVKYPEDRVRERIMLFRHGEMYQTMARFHSGSKIALDYYQKYLNLALTNTEVKYNAPASNSELIRDIREKHKQGFSVSHPIFGTAIGVAEKPVSHWFDAAQLTDPTDINHYIDAVKNNDLNKLALINPTIADNWLEVNGVEENFFFRNTLGHLTNPRLQLHTGKSKVLGADTFTNLLMHGSHPVQLKEIK